ncbi:hypothetical protein GCM10025734_80150 [Kitasatospora paranensis]
MSDTLNAPRPPPRRPQPTSRTGRSRGTAGAGQALRNLNYRGSGFWVGDPAAEVWLHLLSQEAASVADAPAWLSDARLDQAR